MWPLGDITFVIPAISLWDYPLMTSFSYDPTVILLHILSSNILWGQVSAQNTSNAATRPDCTDAQCWNYASLAQLKTGSGWECVYVCWRHCSLILVCKFKSLWLSFTSQFPNTHRETEFLLPCPGFALQLNLIPGIGLVKWDICTERYQYVKLNPVNWGYLLLVLQMCLSHCHWDLLMLSEAFYEKIKWIMS